MPDRGKVITALQLELEYPYSWECADKCPYYGKTDCDCYTQVAKDALELLKEHEPITPTVNEFGNAYCGNCGENVGIFGQTINVCVRMRYCPECGKAVKWDDSDRNGNG